LRRLAAARWAEQVDDEEDMTSLLFRGGTGHVWRSGLSPRGGADRVEATGLQRGPILTNCELFGKGNLGEIKNKCETGSKEASRICRGALMIEWPRA
jgi:hypothetical protein